MLPDPRRRQALFGLGAGLASLVLPGLAAASQNTPARPRRKSQSPAGYAGHAVARDFAETAAARHQLNAGWLLQQLALARRVEPVRRLIMPPPPGVAKSWAAYRARFIEPRRIAAGLDFWQRHASWLQMADERWGVPPEIVLGIIGVETFYGRVMGNFRVLDALATLAFDFPEGRSDRSGFFAAELEEFFVLCSREAVAPTALRGSFAGAMGLPQFMPSSVNRFALDFDGDGHIDLHGSAADAIGSVALYLARFGWQGGLATHFTVSPPQEAAARATLLEPDIRPSFSAAQMATLGAELDVAGLAHEGPLALIELENGDAAASHVAGTQNFYVITRYNRSSYYAMAVIELAQALRDGR